MKTAEEWMKQIGGYKLDEEHPPLLVVNRQLIDEIQLDAYKQGMTDAANIVTSQSSNDCLGDTYDAILTARDNKTKI